MSERSESNGERGAESNGGDAGTSFEFRGLLSQDVIIMAKKFVELEYGLDCLTTLLNGEFEEKSNMIL